MTSNQAVCNRIADLCKEQGITYYTLACYNVPITVDTRISVVPVFRTPTQDVPLFLNTVPM